jgi:hypothetical protein
VLSGGSKGSTQRRTPKFLGALLLLALCPLAQAAAVPNSSTSHAPPTHAHGVIGAIARPLILHLPAPALTAEQAPRVPLPLDEPRPRPPNSHDGLPAVVADRGAAQQPGPGFALPWRESREIVNADIVSLVRNYRRDGLPLVHLWESQQNRVAIGLNSHGMPGIYYTRHVGG